MAEASLSWLNLFVANMQTGFGPFVPARLAASGWGAARIGVALSAGTVAAMLAQVPAGLLCDATMARRGIAAGAIVTIMAALLMIGVMSQAGAVLAAEALQGAAGVTLSLAIAGITLSLSSHEALGERFGHNVRFAAIGGAAGALLLGLVGTRFSDTAVFVVAAGFGLPALLALARIPPDDIRRAPARTRHRAARPPKLREPQQTLWQLLADHHMLVMMACVLLFQLANAALLPLVAGTLVRTSGQHADLVISGAIAIPQLLTAAGSPWLGRLAQRVGRRPVLAASVALLPVRAVVFSLGGPPALTLGVQVLDGVTGAAIGVLVPLIIADITHRGGRFNLALGLAGVATGLGAAVSTSAAGYVATVMGGAAAFLYLAGVGVITTLLVLFALPETMHLPAERLPDERSPSYAPS